MMNGRIAILHYSAPPIVGGVESVMQAHARIFLHEGYPVSIIAGSGSAAALPDGAEFIRLPLLDSQHEAVLKVNTELESGNVSEAYFQLRQQIQSELSDVLPQFEHVIIHNVFSKHFNLPLTDALHMLLDEGKIHNAIAWCHDFSWASPRSLPLLHEGPPWDLLRKYRPDVQYVVVSQKRQRSMAEIFRIPADKIQVIYNGIHPAELLGISAETRALLERLELSPADLLLLMPVRVTQAKNIEFAMHVLKELQMRGCQAHMILTGPPDPHDPENLAYFQSLKELQKSLGIEASFHFIYQSGPAMEDTTILSMGSVGDFYRMCDALFMPSRREGFGMPILEAGFLGKPIFASRIPAVEEIGMPDVHQIDITQDPQAAAQLILDWATHDPVYHLRKKTRENFTWQQIFRKQIAPLLDPGKAQQ